MIRDNLEFNKTVKSNTEFISQLREKLPEFFISGAEGDGNRFDMEKFQKALEENNIAELSSGYQLDFIGKNYAKKQTGERPTTVIIPDNEHNSKSVNKSSNNLFFTGDNLEVLRHLQQNYANSVDFIYIDPPYNTGSDGFIYPDTFEYSDDQLEDMFNLNEDSLKRLKSIQGKSTHSAWLTFMYPRLYLAKKILKDSGVIFISIDDNEQANLKLLMDNIFGESNFTVQFIWTKTSTPPALSNKTRSTTEYVLVYERNNSSKKYYGSLLDNGTVSLLNSTNNEREIVIPANSAKFGFISEGIIRANSFNRVELIDDIVVKEGINDNEFRIRAQVRWTQSRLNEEVKKGTYFTFNTKNMNPRFQRVETSNFKTPNTALYKEIDVETNEEAVKYLSKLGLRNMFDYPKPVSLISYLINMITYDKPNAIIVDFFAGSSTTADAVMQLNTDDGGKRQFIMCTLPEPTFTVNSDGKHVPTKGGEAAFKAGYKSIDEISRERIKRAANKIREENPLVAENMDLGFKHYRAVHANQATLDKIEFDDALQIDIFDDMISAFSSENLDVEGNAEGFDTILQTYLVTDGYKFDVPVEKIDFGGQKLPYVNNQRIYIISNEWSAQNTKALVNAIGRNELVVQTIVVYGYTIDMESLRELEIALNQLENKVHLLVRY